MTTNAIKTTAPLKALDDAGPDIRRGAIACGVFFFGLLGWAAFAPVDAAVVANGTIIVSGNRQTLQHREGGTVTRLNVTEGERVQKGQVLMELASVELTSQRDSLLVQTVELQAQRARLVAEGTIAKDITRPPEWAALPPHEQAIADVALERNRKEMRSRHTSLFAQIDVLAQREDQMGSRISGYEQQIAATETQKKLIQEELDSLSGLSEKGLVTSTRLRSLERAKADLEGRSGELTSNVQQTRQAIGETKMQRSSLEADRSEKIQGEIREVDVQLGRIMPQLAAVREQLLRTSLIAPAAGQVVNLKVFTVGGVIQPGERVLDIVPDDQPLVIEGRVRPEDADDIHPGQTAEVRITALRGRQVTQAMGKVSMVSADAMEDERQGFRYFRTYVQVSKEELERVLKSSGSGELLRVGLPAEIIVPTRKRTMLSYLLGPLGETMRISFREQ